MEGIAREQWMELFEQATSAQDLGRLLELINENSTQWVKGGSVADSIVGSVKSVSLLTLWLVPLLIFASAFSSNWIPTWRALGVPSMLPRFADLSTIPEGL